MTQDAIEIKPESKLRLSSLVRGDVYLVSDPRRVARIGKRTEVDVTSPRGVETVPAVEVEIALVRGPIEGHVDKSEQADLDRINAAQDTLNGAYWTEIWAERDVNPLKKYKGVIMLDEGKFIKQLACVAQIGRNGDAESTSPVTGKPIVAAKVDKSAFVKKADAA
jgi:hypothetical protein